MYLKIIYITIILLIATNQNLLAQNHFSIEYSKIKQNEPLTKLLNDSNRNFVKYEVGKTIFAPHETYWLRLKYNNLPNHTEVLLLINTPITDIDFYKLAPNGNVKHKKAGLYVSYTNQDIMTGDKNKFLIKTNKGENIIYLKLRNEIRFNFNLDNLQITSINEWVLFKQNQQLFQGFYLGVIIVLIIVSLLYKISSIQRINYFYIAYMVSNLILFLFLYEYTAQYLFFNFPHLDLCLIVFMHVASLFFIQFVRYFFQINTLFPVIDKWTKYYIQISLISIFCLLIIAYFDFGLYAYIAITLEVFNQLIGIMLVFLAFRNTDSIGKIISIGAVISTIGVLYMLYNKHLVELTTRNLSSQQAAYLLEVLFMLIAIKVRYVQIESIQKKTSIQNAVLERENKIHEQEKQLLKQENDIIVLKSQLLEKEINEKEKELTLNTIQLTQKDSLLATMQDKIKKILSETTSSNKRELNEILSNLNSAQKSTFWEEFDIYFEQYQNGFLSKLSEKYPTLSKSEKRLCAFLKLGMSSKEIGDITQKNYKSIEVFRSRLRKKLEIESTVNLTDFLNGI